MTQKTRLDLLKADIATLREIGEFVFENEPRAYYGDQVIGRKYSKWLDGVIGHLEELAEEWEKAERVRSFHAMTGVSPPHISINIQPPEPETITRIVPVEYPLGVRR